MMMNVRCQDKERLIAYVYDEQTVDERDLVEAHLAECRACAEEIAELRGVRHQLTTWQTPDADLGFRIVKEPAAPAARRRSWVPAWAALPAAAVVVLAVSAAVANVEVRYDDNGMTVRTGWSRAPQAVAPAPSSQPAAAPARRRSDEQQWRAELAATEQRLRAQFVRPSASVPAATAAASSRDELLRQMRALVAESEARQQRELAIRFTQLVQDVESQRRADLVQIERNLGEIEGLTAAQQREMMQYLVRVSEGR